jgi:hypothetical protein
MEQQTRTEETLIAHFRKLWEEAGGDPSDLRSIRPKDGGWSNALNYELFTEDGRYVRVPRRLLDDRDDWAIRELLNDSLSSGH